VVFPIVKAEFLPDHLVKVSSGAFWLSAYTGSSEALRG
jgi:hypothetical protein